MNLQTEKNIQTILIIESAKKIVHGEDEEFGAEITMNCYNIIRDLAEISVNKPLESFGRINITI